MLSIIVAFDKNQLIGIDNKMPWHYKADLQYFKEVTMNKKVVMGSNTYKSILSYLNKPLPNRHNIVITTKGEDYPGVETYSSVAEFLKKYSHVNEEIFIIGGKMIYEQFLNLVDRLYITHIDKEFTGNIYFPKINFANFNLIKKTTLDELSFCVYERKVQLHE